MTAAQGSDVDMVAYGTPIVECSNYFGPEVVIRSNRPETSLRVFGEGLWGWHRC